MSWSFLRDCTSLGYEPKRVLFGSLGSPPGVDRLLVPMEQRRRWQQQRSRERKGQPEGQAPVDQGPSLEIGAADRRLDALLEEEKRSRAARAQSVPVAAAEMKRLSAEAAGQRHGDQPAASASSGSQMMPDVRQLLVDPRGQALGIGHLQEAVRQSVEVLQHAFQRQPASAPTLLDPLLRPGDHGGHVGPGPKVLVFFLGTG